MKTLDEVIVELESYPVVGETTLTFDVIVVPERSLNDALHYLKEYRSEKAMWEADRKGYLNWIEQYKEAREKHQQAVIELKRNPPLTWDELKAMRGKPVWIEYGNQSRWVIIYGFHGRKSELQYMLVSGVYPDTFWQKDMGTDEYWQAYRKERE